jgi:lipopolysaccharide/colanic/teichoic acid biosynthesis glycosyltransferase
VLAALSLLVRVKLGTPIFFRQLRPGLHGKPFTMVKFRTMIGTLFRFCVSHFHVATSWLIQYAND